MKKLPLGWIAGIIIVIIAVLVFALFFSDVANPRSCTTTVCNFPPGMLCVAHVLRSNGTLQLDVEQITGRKIRITSIACSQSQTPQNWALQNATILNGERSGYMDVICTTASGAVASLQSDVVLYKPTDFSSICIIPMSSSCGNLNWNNVTRFTLWLNYTEVDTGAEKQLVGNVTARYEP